jgi:heme/copper-type cytochrome/quinol oxidase subunit 3
LLEILIVPKGFQMALFSAILFFAALFAAFAAIGSSVIRALPRIDAVIASRGQAVERTIRVGAPRSGWKLA